MPNLIDVDKICAKMIIFPIIIPENVAEMPEICLRNPAILR